MATTTTAKQARPGRFTVSVDDISQFSNFKRAISMMRGVTEVSLLKERKRPRLYDPESGDYLNDETMKAIEDSRNGIGVTTYDSFDDFEKAMRAL